MPVFFAPPLTAIPSAPVFTGAPATGAASQIVPFIRPGVAPVVPPSPLIPPPPALAPLTVAPAAPAIGVGTAIGTGAAILGAGALGLGIGNAIYEDVLGRPFGPSLGDLLFPQAAPEPLPLSRPIKWPFPGGQCETLYRASGSGSYSRTFPAGAGSVNFGNKSVYGPITNAQAITVSSKLVKWTIDAFNASGQPTPNISLGAAGSSGSATFSNPRFDQINIVPLPFGSTDTCGNEQGEPGEKPRARPQPTLPRPLEIPAKPRIPQAPGPLPGPLFAPAPPSTDLPGAPKRLLDPLTDPSPVPKLKPGQPYAPAPVPAPLPQPQPEPVRRKPPTPTITCCVTTERKIDKLLERECPDPCDFSELAKLLEDILEKLCIEGAGSINVSECDAEEPTFSEYQGVGLEGLYSAVKAIANSLSTIHGNTNCPPEPCVSSVPDWWQVRKGANTPQLSVVARKSGTSGYHSLNIPHPITSPPPTSCAIEPYEAGNWQGMLYLSDNSKFIVNAKTKAEALRVVQQAASMIEPSWLTEPLQISTTERRGFLINQALMVPRYMDYHPDGQKGRIADWRVDLRNN